jgi:hypothetical membrane protein
MQWETGIRLWRWGNAVSCFGVIQFVGLCLLATAAYPGGTLVERHTAGYSFAENFLSDLGRSVAWCGKSNTTAEFLFTVAMVVLGLSIIPFFLFLPLHAPDKSAILWVAAVSGIGSALALIWIGLTPYDLHFQAHHTALFFWVVFLLAAVILHAWALFTSEECSSAFAVLSLALAVVIGLYLLRGMEFLFTVAWGSASDALANFATMQKYVVLSAVAWYLVFGIRMVLTTDVRLDKRDATADYMAERFAAWLERGNWRVRRPPEGPRNGTPRSR